MAVETYAELRISSRTLTPEQISSGVGLEADKARKMGEPRASSKGYEGSPIYEKETRWVLRSTLPSGERVEAHIEDLSERIEPVAEAIRALADDNTVTFACVIYADSEEDYNPEVFVPRSTVEFLSALGANFWVDAYFVAEGTETG